MKLQPLFATKESFDIKNNIIIYDTDVTSDTEGIILSANETGECGLIIINQVHKSGVVKVICRPAGPPPVKKYNVKDLVGYLATF